MTKVRQKKGSVEPMTMTQFRAWLQGITDMQPANWHPNLEQWNTIKQRLDSVIDSPAQMGTPSEQFPQMSTGHTMSVTEMGAMYPGHQPSVHPLSTVRPEDILAANALAVPTTPGQSAFA